MAGIAAFLPRHPHLFLLRICIASAFAWTATALTRLDPCSVYFEELSQCDPIVPESFLPDSVRIASGSGSRPGFRADESVFADLLDALNVTQSEYFAPWLGTWPDAIDWTAAIIGTHVSAVTRSISNALGFLDLKAAHATDWKRASNLVDNYFTQIIAYYFGQDAFMIRNEAYDDILWVVLGWLETNKFINSHNDLHYRTSASSGTTAVVTVPDVIDAGGVSDRPRFSHEQYYGNSWVAAFSHRARVFWDLASHGWDTKLCEGGMIWNPRLLPYKNAITNQLFVAASISMYLYFPGDDNQSPFSNPGLETQMSSGSRDAKYLKAAVDGYRWLRSSNMTNSQGLFVDGFHVSGYLDQNSNNTRCDQRDEMVFSYNQGVILTGLRGLWDATDAPSFLSEGHALIQNVINATGYDLSSNRPVENIQDVTEAGVLPKWHGLGRLGVLEETCDASATCSQDGQTFKGIFFHHLTAFCAPLTLSGLDAPARAAVARKHADACRSYAGWLAHNVHAASSTRDATGRFGAWWTAGLLSSNWSGAAWPSRETDGIEPAPNATDYRNYGIPNDTTWRGELLSAPRADFANYQGKEQQQLPLGIKTRNAPPMDQRVVSDPNSRGRGRTVETQGGGLALLRAYWEISRLS
ncbi:glycoside hydrolase family 76 protein [Xylaria sp. CBS 124048]|nr:glycoside hydrolase family 76 protein [Xylaria sp. CBS 124048]